MALKKVVVVVVDASSVKKNEVQHGELFDGDTFLHFHCRLKKAIVWISWSQQWPW